MSLPVSLRAFGDPWKAGVLKTVNSHRPLPLCAPPPQEGQIRRSALVVHLGRNRKIFEACQMSAPPGAASRSAARTRVPSSPAHPPGGSAWPLVARQTPAALRHICTRGQKWRYGPRADRLARTLLEQTATHYTSTQSWGSSRGSAIPNAVFGYGLVNILAAVQAP